MVLKKFTYSIVILIILQVFSCVSKSQYMALEKDLSGTRNKLKNTETGRDKCAENLEETNALYKGLEDDNRKLSHEIDLLLLELEKGKSLIKLQEGMIDKMGETKNKIEADLKEQIANQEIKLEEMEGKLKVSFIDKILFGSGRVKIKERGKKALLKVADSLKSSNQNIVVQGHTDNVPIGSVLQNKYPTNWELSAVRATTIVRFFLDEGGLDPQRFSASGFGDCQPVASNDNEEGRSQNRRIEIILVPSR